MRHRRLAKSKWFRQVTHASFGALMGGNHRQKPETRGSAIALKDRDKTTAFACVIVSLVTGVQQAVMS